MICGSCKAPSVNVDHVRACYGQAHPATGMHEAEQAHFEGRERVQTPVERVHAASSMLPDVERAHYALLETPCADGGHWNFYQVDKPQDSRWKGYTFVKRQAGDEMWPVRPFSAALMILEAIAVDPGKALTDYGHQLGQCGICNRTLTNPESIAAGIGPICAGRL